jgi:hypothetical protein
MKAVERVDLIQVKDLADRLIKKHLFSVTAYGPIQKNILDAILL